MDVTLGKLTFGKLIGFVLPGFMGSVFLFFLIDSFSLCPGSLFQKFTTTATDLAAFSVLLLIIGVGVGIVLDNLHHALLIPLYRKSKRFRALEQSESPKVEMIKLLIIDAVRKYGIRSLKKNPGDKKRFIEFLGKIRVDDLEWWFIFPLSGGSIYSLFVEEYYAPLQFLGSMSFALFIACFSSFFYEKNVLHTPDIWIGRFTIPVSILTVIIILSLVLLCIQRAKRNYLYCYENQVNLIFGTIIDLGFHSFSEEKIKSRDTYNDL